ncbi:MAG: sensor histidine kinase [Opitutaceae bacterium]|nr:sensor histidine kinase [Opitutaceae bacterium]
MRNALPIVLLALALPLAAQERVLTTALEVRSLTPAEAASGIPVKLRGVVVHVEGTSAVFLQDDTSTAFFRMAPRAKLPEVGDEIELTSKTRMGLYLPGLDDTTYRLLGRRALPPGIPAQFDDLYFGRYHYQRVTVEGIVRSVQPRAPNKSLLRLAMGSRVIDVRIERPPEARPLVDHRVRITGLAAGLINTPRRQLVQPYVTVIDWGEVEVIAFAPPAADAPLVSAEELLAFRVTGLGEQRVRIEGTVAAAFGEQIFLRQGEQAFAVRFAGSVTLDLGDNVTVVGFPSMERFSASVVDAELLARAPGVPPDAVLVAALDDLYGRSGDQQPGKYDGMVVRVSGTVRDVFTGEDGVMLLLQGHHRTVQVRVPAGGALPVPGTVVRVTGVCQVETAVFGPGFRSDPGLVSVRALSSDGVEQIRTPPWWTPRRLGTGLAVLAGAVLLAGLWIAILRRQVARQTAALRHRIETEAALEERQRIAREFHDTLEQELAGVSLRLDALATRVADEKGRSLVGASRNLVARIQTETRDLIGDLRDPAEMAGDLSAALAGVAARHAADSGANVGFAPAKSVPLLPAAIVHDLRMIARESVTNALKHGAAKHVAISVDCAEEKLTLRITDDGCGFDPSAATLGKRGHFGCAGIRERARKIGADVAWRSHPGAGTTVEVVMPCLFGPPSLPPTPPDARRPAHGPDCR